MIKSCRRFFFLFKLILSLIRIIIYTTEERAENYMKHILRQVTKDKRKYIIICACAVVVIALISISIIAAQLKRSKNTKNNIADNTIAETKPIQETTAYETTEEDTTEESAEVVEKEAVEQFFENEISTENEASLELPYRQLTSEFIPYDGQKREITCYGDSMMAGAGCATPGSVNGVDIYGWTSPYTLEKLSEIPTHNLGVSGEDSYAITFRAGGVKVYLDRDITISEDKYAFAQLVDDNGDVFSYDDYSGYVSGHNDGAGDMYIDGYLCDVENAEDSEVKIKLTDGYAAYKGSSDTGVVLYYEEETTGSAVEKPEQPSTGSVVEKPEQPSTGSTVEKPEQPSTESPQKKEVTIQSGTQAMTRASQERSAKDILILEMGSNGGWQNDYKQLILQYDSIILNSGCQYYIIVGDTDNPAESADGKQDEYGADGNYVGIGDTSWEAALREAYGDHFFNTRTYMIQYGLSDCGLDTTTDDLENFKKGNISEQLRYDWTHFNCYGYYAKGMGIYEKGVELGYWS